MIAKAIKRACKYKGLVLSSKNAALDYFFARLKNI